MPRKIEETEQTERVAVRFTPDERAEVLAAAAAEVRKSGARRVSLAAYIRDAALARARGKGGRW